MRLTFMAMEDHRLKCFAEHLGQHGLAITGGLLSTDFDLQKIGAVFHGQGRNAMENIFGIGAGLSAAGLH
jgi:hypothetical protein